MHGIADRFKQVRKKVGLSQVDFSKNLGVTQAYVSKIERNVAEPSDQFIKLTCMTYGIRELWLKEGRGPRGYEADIFDYLEKINQLSPNDVLGILNSCTIILQEAEHRILDIGLGEIDFKEKGREFRFAKQNLKNAYKSIGTAIDFLEERHKK